ncbi:MAG TPA: DNA gyrase C-terminal beta-propeller domain-containing protein, partial [Gemmatimonadales bacterium]|nr:DNA gyrase C-terminal beta-propeller domain-containing protein [Gemmatimonadales bacterium]
ALIDDPDATLGELRKHVKGPDFPTGGFIYGREGIKEAYETGRGRVVMRARVVVEEKASTGKSALVVTEIPYQVNKATLHKDIAALVNEKRLEGISDVRDESDRDGMRLVIELKRDAIPHVVLNQLYKHTAMQSTFGVINLALVKGQPKVMPLRELLEHFVEHRHDIIVRRTTFDLKAAEEREHILEGLKIAVDNIDEVITIIRGSADSAEADTKLRARFGLSERQSEAILNMRLARLTGLEIDKLEAELKDVRATIAELRGILKSRERRMRILKEEMEQVARDYGDDRRTEIIPDQTDFSVEDLIAEEDMVITISHSGYVKRIPVSTYRRQRRGGRGLTGATAKEDDWIEHLFIASTHDYVMFFSDKGQVYWLKVHEIPQGGRAARGKPVIQCIAIRPDERVTALVPVREFSDTKWLMFATRKGTVKKTVLSAYGNPRSNGINAINIEPGDELIDAQITDGNNDVVLATRGGMSIRFHESDVREMGRATTGVKGIELERDDSVIGMVVIRRDSTLLVVSEKGFGKRSELSEYRVQRRGGKGIITFHNTDKTGACVALKEVLADDELMMITKHGIIIRVPVDGIRVIGRNTQGVRVMNLDDGDLLVSVARVVKEDEGGAEEPTGDETPAPAESAG